MSLVLRATPWAYGFALMLGVLVCSPAQAALAGYTSEASFLAATTGFQNVQIVNFDGLPAAALGDPPGTPTLFASGTGTGGLTFTYALTGAPSLQVDTGFDTSSGGNYLGVDNGNGAFYNSTADGFTITFDHPVTAAGLYVIAAASSVSADDFTLSTMLGSVLNSATPDRTFADGGAAYFLGFVADGPAAAFTSITLASTPNAPLGFYTFNVDDIRSAVSPVPEPTRALLLLLGVLTLAARRTHVHRSCSAQRRKP